jgi:type VI secretion system protein ImpB
VNLRKFVEFDMDNLDNRMAAIQPGVSFRVDNKLSENAGEKLGVSLRFNKMADFEPAAVAKQVPALAKLLEARTQLANLMRYMDGKVAAEDTLRKLLADPQLMLALKKRADEQGDGGEGSA